MNQSPNRAILFPTGINKVYCYVYFTIVDETGL